MVNQSGLDPFKNRTLDLLAKKGENPKSYPISSSDLLIHKTCPLCKSPKLSVITEVYIETNLCFFQTSMCNQCTLIFRSISPSLSWFKECWNKIASDKLEVFNPPMEAIRKERYTKYADLLSKYVKSGRTLDIGSGYGTGASVFNQKGYNVEVVEAEIDKARYVEKVCGLKVIATSVEELQKQSSPYDLIIFAHCLEHLDDPLAALLKIKEMLTPEKGILYLEVPVLKNSVSWSDALYLCHKSNYSEELLLKLVQDSGFEILEKVNFRHSAEEPWDFGVVLKVGTNHQKTSLPPVEEALMEAQKLYRQGLPASVKVENLPSIIKYNVPFIEQFFCTLRLDTKKPIGPDSETGFVDFQSTESIS